MKTETKALNELLANHKIPHIRTTIIPYGRKTNRMYYNAMTKVRGSVLEDVVGKEIYDKNDYVIFERKGYSITKYLCYEIPETNMICFLELNLSLYNLENRDTTWCITQVFLYNKNKEIQTCIDLSTPDFYGTIPVIYDENIKQLELRRYARTFLKNNEFLSFSKTIYSGLFYSQYRSFSTFVNCTRKEKEIGINGETFEDIAKMFVNFFGGKIKNIGGSRVVDITESAEALKKYLLYKEPKGMKEENIKKDKFLNINLPEISYDSSYENCVGFISRVDENMCVLRTMQKDEENEKMNEICKIFIDKKKTYAYKKNDFGNWCKMRLSATIDTLNFKLIGYESKNTDGTMLEYFGNVVEDVPNDKRDLIVRLLLTDPFLEQILKSDFKEFALYCLLNSKNLSYNNWKLKYFGKINNNQKSFNKRIGLNKHQIEWFAKFYTKNKEKAVESSVYWCEAPFLTINMMRNALNSESVNQYYYFSDDLVDFYDISYLDNKSFDLIVNTFKNRSDSKFILRGIANHIVKIYGLPTLINMLDYVKIFDKAVKRNWNVFTTYNDYFCIIEKLSLFEDFNKSAYKPYFDKSKPIESITAMHDLVTELYNVRESEFSKKAFKNETKKLSKWTFTDGDFTVIAPEKPDDLAIEGTTLHHCVKSYIGRVVEGRTNIMFIRKVSEKDKPFYTVEVSNNGTVEQIHGSCNCNVEKGSSLEQFVKNWMKAKKLKTSNFNKVR